MPLFLANLLVFSVRIPHAVGATPSSSHEPMEKFSFRGRPSAPPLSRVEPRPFSFILPSAKIHFSVGFSFIPSKHSFDGSPFLPFVGALPCSVPLFLANLLAFSVRFPHAVGATPCGRPNQWKNFHFAAVHRRLLSPASNHALFRSFCPRPKFTFRSGSPLSHQSIALMGALFYLLWGPCRVLCRCFWPICSHFLCVFRMP